MLLCSPVLAEGGQREILFVWSQSFRGARGGCVSCREEEPTCLRVPEFKVAVVASAEELGPGVVEANVSHRFAVT